MGKPIGCTPARLQRAFLSSQTINCGLLFYFAPHQICWPADRLYLLFITGISCFLTAPPWLSMILLYVIPWVIFHFLLSDTAYFSNYSWTDQVFLIARDIVWNISGRIPVYWCLAGYVSDFCYGWFLAGLWSKRCREMFVFCFKHFSILMFLLFSVLP